MSQKEPTELQLIDELQFSIDAVGTILNTDLPRLMESLLALHERVDGIEDHLKSEHLTLNGITSALQDIDAKLDILLGKVDLLEKRITELPQQYE